MTNTNKQQVVLGLFHKHADSYMMQKYGITWDGCPDFVSPWNEGLTENMTNSMIKVLAVKCCKRLVKKLGYS